ncbi:hypothetical protein F2Q68_00015807 [Brassica cretica]|uniref:Uncharacterized protein n=1 Tax=Brassica cretica TaxID=69181 RepID=A0A8S9HZ41_BRACR|nr:hypothetical protein F2Q68_00015807 [Brassica cretica]
MPSSARSNKETPLLFSIDPASLERLIRKERRFSSIDNNTSSSINTCQPTSTQTPISSTDTRSPLSTESTLPSTDIFLPTSIDTSSQTSIDTEPRNMVATLVLVRDENGDLHDQEVHLRNAANDDFWQVVKHEKLQEGDFEVESSMNFGGSHWCRSTSNFEHRSTDFNQSRSISFPEHRSTTPTESAASCNAVRIMTHKEFTARHPYPPSSFHVNIDRQTKPAIDIARINALMPQPKPSANPPETTSTHSEDVPEPMQVDKATMGRTLRKRKEKVAKHLKRGANEMEMDNFLKRVLRIPLEKPFEEAYFTNRLKHETLDKSSIKVATQRPNACFAWSLRSDRARARLGCYVATELEPKLGRYVATERPFRSVAT